MAELDQGKHKTQASFPNKPNGAVVRRGQCSSVQPQLSASPSPDPTARYFYYFEIFVQRNIFTPNVASYNRDIQSLLGTGPTKFLHHAVLALGALQSSQIGAESRANRKEYEYAALEAYSTSLTALRDTMENCPSPPRLLVFWTTLFLGILELMQGETGDVWLMHMVHVTASTLQAAGPGACQSGLGLSFFFQAHIFEASRAQLLGERSFLSNPEWGRFTRNLPSVDGSGVGSRLDHALNVIVQCSKIRALAVQMLARVEPSHVSQVPKDAPSIAKEGFRLRQMLEAWRTDNPAPQAQALATPYTYSVLGGLLENLISNIFFAAISIYLSGIFDYEILHWQR
ncbi:C6 finger domain-containing protein [Apiospora aurea]|uniref:C6 finger domain-containing protein n=1 Tax=Apiospora aurea TaxID=335848 RepID=A0ABR1QLL0_9PEZI